MNTERLKPVIKSALIICAVFFNINLSAQNIISRDLLDYPDGDVPGICSTDPSDPGCIITLPPALPEQDYYFQIPLISEPRINCSFNVIQTTPCESGSQIPNSASGDIDMPAATRCTPLGGNNYIEIEVIVSITSGPNAGDADNLKYILPVYRNPIKVVLVLDISESMGLIVSGGTDTRWNVLKNSVNLFTSEFEKYYQEGDSISVIYFSEDTIMPDSPIDSNFIAITPEDFTPLNLKSSEIINSDMLNRTLQDSAAMGNALLLAKAKLQNTDATKVVILFTDGHQSKDPLIHEYLGNKLYNGEFLNNGPCSAIDSIRYYTIGMGSSGSIPIVLENISLVSAAENINTTTGEATDPELHDFFQNQFNDLLNGNRPAIETRIIDLSPFDDSLNVPVTNDLKVYFNETVTANSGFITIKRSSDDSEFASISVTSGLVTGSGTSVITINPDSDLESNTEYYILIDGTAFKNSKDITVTGISAKTYWNFTSEDILPPSVTISSLENNPTNTDPFEINLEFNEEINGFDVSEITVTNGVASNLATTDSISFTVDIASSVEGLITIKVNADVVTDNAGDLNTESNTFEINFDSERPTVILTADNDTTNTAEFDTYVNFSEKIRGFNDSKITVTNGNVNSLSTSDSIDFVASISAISQGETDINVSENQVTDAAGNMNSAADELTITYHIPTSIEILEKEGISIYTNEGFVIVDFKKSDSQNFKSGNIEIYSLNGSLMKKERLENNSRFKTYLNDKRGIYLVKLTLDNEIYYAKIQN
jgi:Bacterial Ig-like domain/von Willebrand factor type A domain